MTFLPDLHTLALYSAACVFLFITPGPDMSLWLAKTISGGRRGGTAAMLGTQVGCLFHTFFAAVGLSAVLAASATAFTALKIVGALYLLWLAYGAIRSGSALNVRDEGKQEAGFWSTFMVGFGINLTNPKVVLFFLTFLPQFVDATDPHASQKLFFLGLYFIAINLPFAFLLILGAEKVVSWLKARPRVLRGIDFTFAGVFGLFAFKILTTQTR
ncbi:LysE family translocator [Labrys sp. KNU-23]|uniref:LysE family translocator n=1 Tax=Labrys sp. KNU-23 TaxID=2789216 RepID=UPI0011EC1E09|nr:LysE family translocator [Labrys sp. KNU-23]QEN88536.1 LysE family translocator [Labrys sp. KNU-23]